MGYIKLNEEAFEPLPPEQRLKVYLRIARDARLHPSAQGIRRAAVKNAWAARQELREKERNQ